MKPTATIIALAACTPSVPDQPSYQQDIAPLLAANCIRCHGVPNLGGAPATFRLDTFGDVVVREGAIDPAVPCGPSADTDRVVMCGASSRAALSSLRARDDAYPMPPRFPLDDFQIELLDVWARDPSRGAPRADNHPPSLALVDRRVDVDAWTFVVDIDDPDGDVVGGSLVVRNDSGEHVVGLVRSGPQRVAWSAAGIAAGTYLLVAILDDGAAPHEASLGTIEIGDAR